MNKKLKTNSKVCLVLLATFLLSFGITSAVLSGRTPQGTRKTNPPDPPTNPNPSDKAKGITGNKVTLMWMLNTHYRGDHKEIDKSWVKVSTRGPVYSDEAHAEEYDGVVGGTALELPVEMATTYYWAVKSHDEDGWGDYSNWKFTTNYPPVAEITKVNPSPARESVAVEFRGAGNDPMDGDPIVKYKWESSEIGPISEQKGFTVDTLPVGVHTISLKVMDNKGLWSEETEESIEELDILPNHAPTKPGDLTPLETHSLRPQITWYPSEDPNDEDDITYHLKIGSSNGGIDVADITTSKSFHTVSRPLSYSDRYVNGKSENTYYIELYARDSFGKASDTLKETFAVVNYKPTAPTVSISPANPSITKNLALAIMEDSKDRDGDEVDYTKEWYLDDNPMPTYKNRDVIPKKELKAGQRWEVRVAPNDGIADGFTGKATVEIVNTPPEVRISSPEDGLEIDNAMSLFLDAGNTTDIDREDELEFTWSSDHEGELGKGEKLSYFNKRNPLDIGEHSVTLTVTDGTNIVREEVRIKVVGAKYPDINAGIILPKGNKLYIGEKTAVNVEVRNDGVASAENVVVFLFNDISGDGSYQAFEKIESWKVGTLDSGGNVLLSTDWKVKEPAKLFVKVEGKNLHPNEDNDKDNDGKEPKPMFSPELYERTDTEDQGIPVWLWIVIALLGVAFLGGMGFLIYYKSTSYEDEIGDEFYDLGGAGDYGAPTRQLQQELSRLQNIINTHLPQYAPQGAGTGYLALPPASGGTTEAQQGWSQGYEGSYPSYSPQTYYRGQGIYSTPRLALPPGPSDLSPPQGEPGPDSASGRLAEEKYPAYPFPPPTPPTPRGAPPYGGKFPEYGGFSGASGPVGPAQSYGTPPPPRIVNTEETSGVKGGSGLDLGRAKSGVRSGTGTGGSGGGWSGTGWGDASRSDTKSGTSGRSEDRSKTGWGGGSGTETGPDISGRREAEETGGVESLSSLPGEPLPMQDTSAESSDLPVLESHGPEVSEEDLFEGLETETELPVIQPETLSEEEKIVCHICRTPVEDTGEERPYHTVCENCGARVDVA